MTDTVAAPPGAQRTPVYAWLVLFMLMFIYIFNFLDRQLMSILIEPIKEEMGFTDGEMGLMTGFYFALFYTAFGVIVGFLADRTSRKWILGTGAILWSGFTALCGLAQNYPTMLAARVGVGVGEAAGAPPSYSIISDYFPAEKRGLALALFSLGVPFGQALGAGFGAAIHEAYGWRNAFIGIGVAGVVATIVMLLVVREPKRGATDVKLHTSMEEAPTQAEAQPGFAKTFWEFMSRPVLLWTALGCGLCSFVGYAALGWNVSFIVRVKGINYGEVALFYALMLAVAMGLGTWLSGAAVDWLSKRSKVWYALVPGSAMALAIPFWLAYVWAPTWEMSIALLSIPTFLTIMYLPPALALVQNSVKPSQRTMSGALLLMILNIIGLGGGPTMVGILSQSFSEAGVAGGMEAAAASAQGLQTALYWTTPFYLVAVAFIALEAMAVQREVKAGGPISDGGFRFGLLLTLVGLGGLYGRAWGLGAPGDIGALGTAILDVNNLSQFGSLELAAQINTVMNTFIGVAVAIFLVWGVYLLFRSLGRGRTAEA